MQVICSLILNTVYTCTLIHLLPLEDLSEQRYAIFNEIIVLLVIYFLMYFQYLMGLGGQGAMLENLGIALVCLIGLNFMINFVPVILSTRHQFRKYRYTYHLKQQAKTYDAKLKQERIKLQERTEA